MHGAFERTAEANSGQRGRVQGERTTVSRQFEAQFVQMSPSYLYLPACCHLIRSCFHLWFLHGSQLRQHPHSVFVSPCHALHALQYYRLELQSVVCPAGPIDKLQPP
uniref:Uncharacterized protein n=1 Tax=Cacopsylla melanoneura TaxID=428564 RepID=A0A8D8QNV8_9HEMI